jgi:hypothetical protein
MRTLKVFGSGHGLIIEDKDTEVAFGGFSALTRAEVQELICYLGILLDKWEYSNEGDAI